MNNKMIKLADEKAEDLIYNLNNTFHVPSYLWAKAEATVNAYKEIISLLIKEKND